MKLFDRYILWLFVKNYLISLTVLIGLYIVMDMVFGFDKIVAFGGKQGANPLAEVWAAVQDVASYYFFHSFLIFVQLSGIIPVVAAAFTFLRLSRFNELTALLAAGVPMLRLTVPVVAAAVALNLVLIGDQELVLPRMVDRLVVKADEMHRQATHSFAIRAMPVAGGTVLLAAQFFPGTKASPPTMEYMDVLDRGADAKPLGHWYASAARWDQAAGRWDLSDGHYVSGLAVGDHRSPVEAVATYAGKVTPQAIALYRGSEAVELLATARINELIASGTYGASSLYRTKYLRYTQPVMNVVLLLLAVPTVLTYDAKTLKTSATRALTLLAMAMGSVFVCQQVAAKPPLGPAWVSAWPLLMSCVPILIFLPVAVWQLERVRT